MLYTYIEASGVTCSLKPVILQFLGIDDALNSTQHGDVEFKIEGDVLG